MRSRAASGLAAFAFPRRAAARLRSRPPPPPLPARAPPRPVRRAALDPCLGPQPDARRAPFRPPVPAVYTTSSGMQVWLLERHALPVVAVTVAVPSGASSDPKRADGPRRGDGRDAPRRLWKARRARFREGRRRSRGDARVVGVGRRQLRPAQRGEEELRRGDAAPRGRGRSPADGGERVEASSRPLAERSGGPRERSRRRRRVCGIDHPLR